MEIEFKRTALKQLAYYKKKNPKAYQMIYSKIEEIRKNPNDIKTKKIKKYPKYKRVRRGKYRICFRIKDNCIYIGRIDDRGKVYK